VKTVCLNVADSEKTFLKQKRRNVFYIGRRFPYLPLSMCLCTSLGEGASF